MIPRLQAPVGRGFAALPTAKKSTLDEQFWTLTDSAQNDTASVATGEKRTTTGIHVGTPQRSSWFQKLKAFFLSIFHYFLSSSRKSTSTKGPTVTSRKPVVPLSVHAVIIGINSYQNLETLSGAADDARAFSAYLQEDLSAGPDSTQLLLTDGNATRAAILEGLEALANNAGIKEGDPIIVFFAGHTTDDGGEMPALVPCSWAAEQSAGPISSSELNAMLAKFQKRSDNITLVIDGRLSAKMGQGAERKVRPALTCSAPLDGEASSKAPCIIVSSSRGEAGQEDCGRGRFTVAFLKALRRHGITPITFRSVAHSIGHIVGQHPRCSNVLAEGTLFGLDLKPGIQTKLEITHAKGEMSVSIGAVAGITYGAEFAIYSKQEDILKGKPVMTCATEAISPFATRLKPLSGRMDAHLGKAAVAVLSKAGLPYDSVVHVVSDDANRLVHEGALAMLRRTGQDVYRTFFSENATIADIGIKVLPESPQLRVSVMDERATIHGHELVAQPVEPNPEAILHFLTYTAHFYRHLNQLYLNPSVGGSIAVELMRLKESHTRFDDNGYACLLPASENLFQGGVAHVTVPSKAPARTPIVYGFKVTNGSEVDLYPTMWYFDNSEFSITRYYPRDGASPTKLGKGQSVTIGYEDGTAAPFAYFLPEGQEVDVGFVKIIFSTEPITDLDFVAQGSAFDKGTGREKPSELKQGSRQVEGVWGSVLHTIVQRRA